jgi:tetratricopeptide (TPR) repeat protein
MLMTREEMDAPCPCGSEKKYKKCCRYRPEEKVKRALAKAEWEKGEEERRIAYEKEKAEWEKERDDLHAHALSARIGTKFENADPDEMYNAISALMYENRIDEAEKLAKDMQIAFQELADGAMYLGDIAMIRNEYEKAADYYHEVVDLTQKNGGYDREVMLKYYDLEVKAYNLAIQNGL